MPYFKLLVAVSEDGFIASKEYPDPEVWTSEEDKEILSQSLLNSDWSIMGRITHENYFRKKRKRLIFTRNTESYFYDKDVPNHCYFNPDRSQFSELKKIVGETSHCLVLGGRKVHDYFLYLDVLDEILITVEPINLKEGIPCFTYLSIGELKEYLIQNNYLFSEKTINDKGSKLLKFNKSFR